MATPRRRKPAGPIDDPVPPTPRGRRLVDGRIRQDYPVALEAGELGPRRTALLVVRTHPGTGERTVTLAEQKPR
jgi:hypothetical protein